MPDIDYDNVVSRISDNLKHSSHLERNVLTNILREIADKGYSETYERIVLQDFKEIPVSIDTFLVSPKYLGGTNSNGANVYPGWWDAYRTVFNPDNDINEVVLSGATRIGKTSTMVSMMAYQTYLAMCYRDIQSYFHLKSISRITIAFANLTKDLASGIAFREYNDTLKNAPWFNDHGKWSSSINKYVYIPEGNQIELVTASDSAHLLGMQLWACLVGNTQLITSDGVKSIESCVGTYQDILQLTDNGWQVTNALVAKTKEVSTTIRVELQNGSIIEGTPDHLVMLTDGTYKKLGDLSDSDDILTFDIDKVARYHTKIKSIHKIENDTPIPVFDVVNVQPNHNFAIVSGNSVIVSHNCAMDECNFTRANVKDISISKQHMKKLYETAMTRITGTFSLHGKVYGKMFTASSKNTDDDYLSEHIETQLNSGNTHMYLFDKPQWEVIPAEKFSTERFHITIGDRYHRGSVVPKENDDPEHLHEYEKQGYRIMAIPKNYESSFRADYDIALRDIAGISVVGSMGFMTQDMITPCIATDRRNPFYEPILWIGTQDSDSLENHFHMNEVPTNLRKLPNCIHIDFAESSDHIGISSVVQDGNKIVYNSELDKKISVPFFKQVFAIAIGCPQGDRMSYQKVVNFILWLRQAGLNVSLVSTDQFQSSYVLETLNQKGIATDKLSVDRNADPYIALRNAFVDQRIELIPYKLQEDELIHLERTSDNKPPDHPPQHSDSSVLPSESNGWSSKGIGKDSADALCGALNDCLIHQTVARPSGKHIAKAITTVNGPRILTSNNVLPNSSIIDRALAQHNTNMRSGLRRW
jgi:hypothetical protein